MTDLDAIRARHVNLDGRCRFCKQQRGKWPCDTAIVLAALDASVLDAELRLSQSQDEADDKLDAAIERERRLDVDHLRQAMYIVSQRHDWEHVVDREDRTQEIADEYAALATEAE